MSIKKTSLTNIHTYIRVTLGELGHLVGTEGVDELLQVVKADVGRGDLLYHLVHVDFSDYSLTPVVSQSVIQ